MNNVVLKQEAVLQLNKKSLQELGASEAQRLLNEGFHDALELSVFSKKYMEMLTAFNKALKSETGNILEANGRKVEMLNSKIALVNGAAYYNWEEDSIYASLKAQMDARKTLLQAALKSPIDIADAETGSVVPKVGIKRVGDEMVKITL